MLSKSLLVILLSLGFFEKSIADNQLRIVTRSTPDEQKNQNDRSLATLKIVGNNGGDGFPLGNCEGDCDNDNECSGSLKCFQRSGSEDVPGCSGDRSSYKGVDFCYNGSGGGGGGGGGDGGGGGSGNGGFRLKLYWQRGYYWQEGGCRSGASLDIHNCDRGGTRFEFVGSGRIQIKVRGTNLCMALVGRNAIELRNCDSGDDRQRFTAGAGDFNGRRFEFNPVVNGGCVSNSHHPKDGEVIYRQTCQRSRVSTTSYWVKY